MSERKLILGLLSTAAKIKRAIPNRFVKKLTILFCITTSFLGFLNFTKRIITSIPYIVAAYASITFAVQKSAPNLIIFGEN
jgi:hypothetical protein